MIVTCRSNCNKYAIILFPRPDSTEQPASIAALPLTRPISIDEFQLHDVNPPPLTSSCHRSFNVHPRNVYLRFHVRVRAVRSIATRVPARITCKTRGKTWLFIAKRMRPTGVSVLFN